MQENGRGEGRGWSISPGICMMQGATARIVLLLLAVGWMEPRGNQVVSIQPPSPEAVASSGSVLQIVWPRQGTEVSPIGFVVRAEANMGWKVIFFLNDAMIDESGVRSAISDDGERNLFEATLRNLPIGLHTLSASLDEDGAHSGYSATLQFFVGRESASLELRLRALKGADRGKGSIARWVSEHVDGLRDLAAEPDEHGGMGLVAKNNVEPGTIGSMPFSACIGPEGVIRSHAAAYLTALYDSIKLPPDLVTAMFLLIESIKDSSFFAPYISTLPLPGSIDSLYAWDGARDDLLTSDPSFLAASHHAQQYFERVYERLFTVVMRDDKLWGIFDLVPAGTFTRQNVMWALSIVWSRSWQVGSSQGGLNRHRLVPFIDLANHAPPPPWGGGGQDGRHITLGESEAGYAVQLAGGGMQGESFSSVTVSYGDFDNMRLFTQYGFVLDPNPNDVALILPPNIVLSVATLSTSTSGEDAAWRKALAGSRDESCGRGSLESEQAAHELAGVLWDHAVAVSGGTGGVGGLNAGIDYLKGRGAQLSRIRVSDSPLIEETVRKLENSFRDLQCKA